MSDPFALMTNPQSVLAAVEASDRLRALRSRVCRPLDKVGFGRGDGDEEATDMPEGQVWGEPGDDAPPLSPPGA